MDAGPGASRTAGGARCWHAGDERLAGGCPLCPRLLGPCQQGHSGHRVRAGPSQWGWRWWRGCCALRAAGSLGAARTPALCPALAQISPRQSRLGSVCSHRGCCLSLCCLLCPQLAALLWFCSASLPVCPCACVCMYVPVCSHVHVCPSAPTCIMHPCTSLCTVCTVCMLCPCASLCIHVHLCALCACPAPVHPCAPHACGRLRRPHRQRLLLGLAWGSALGTALGGSRRLIPSRCGCREPGSAPPPHRGPRRFGPVPGGAAGAHKAAPARLLHCSWAVYGVLLAALCCSSAALLLAVSAPAFADPELVSQ